jgi:rhodanese-related sulfurtransferase
MQFISPKEVSINKLAYSIIDIRERYEYDFGNIGCLNIPMDEFCSRMDELPKNQKIVLMCQSGKRATALGNLLSIDFNKSDILVLEGGIQAWKNTIEPALNIE